MEENKITVAYWPVQGVVHPTRLLLSYFKVPFEDKFYAGREDWFGKDKVTLNTPMPSLPYIKDGDFTITESLACIQYASLKTGQKDLLGKNDLDSVRVFQLWGLYREIILTVGTLAWNKEFEKDKDIVLKEKIEPLLDKFAKNLGDQEYPLGYLTWADFLWVHAIEVVSRLRAESVTAHPNLVKYRDRIYSNEGIQAYRRSEKYPKTWTMSFATWPGEENIQ